MLEYWCGMAAFTKCEWNGKSNGPTPLEMANEREEKRARPIHKCAMCVMSGVQQAVKKKQHTTTQSCLACVRRFSIIYYNRKHKCSRKMPDYWNVWKLLRLSYVCQSAMNTYFCFLLWILRTMWGRAFIEWLIKHCMCSMYMVHKTFFGQKQNERKTTTK